MSFLSKSTVLLLFVLCCAELLFNRFEFSFRFLHSKAYDALDPNGNITIKWDIVSWTPDGYVALVNIYNYQQFRHIQAPGWSLGWTWQNNEVIWSVVGGQTTEQGNCSRFKGNIPRCCKKSPTVVDLSPRTPHNQKIANCCKGGVISSMVQDPANSASSFQISVGSAGTNNRTVRIPKNITLNTPGPVTWNITCTYSQFLAYKTPSCCVSLSSFNSKAIASCPTCSCGCRNNINVSTDCVNPKSPNVPVPGQKNIITPLVQCTSHMCPIKIQWHLKLNYKDFWRVRITIRNLNYHMNYNQWNLVVQHPNFDNLTQVFGSKYKALTLHSTTNDAAMLWGIKDYNDVLMQAGRDGKAQLELLFRKDKAAFTSTKGWAFPQRIYFNGDNCFLPSPDAYPMVA
ncbi:hypothetical protein OIU84_002830 [Salix udensis]|uniref:COBRA-like protein n=1 Tax=Salix udensis TaxID=889485 RepID=A0AAD6K6G6_9ROSI|nr:hypothetical protein OIU84_002830 [Salix udensis]